MEQVLENKHIRIAVTPKGAELQSILHKDNNIEYLWSGDPAFWGKKSPVLFPIVGGLKNNSYTYKGNTYNLSRHGFARDMEFSLYKATDHSLTYKLEANEQTLAVYPFLFQFLITYTLSGQSLTCTYEVKNADVKPMFFSVGAHPAFAVPFEDGTNFSDYTLSFNEQEEVGRWPLSSDGLIEKEAIPFFERDAAIESTKQLFYGDALVFKNLKSTNIRLHSSKTKHGFDFSWKDFPFMGIWSAKDANFVCIEPWCGIADSIDSSGDITKKEGINLLIPGELFTRSWQVQIF